MMNKCKKKGLFVANTFMGLGQATVNDAKLFMRNLHGYDSKLLVNPTTKDMLSELINLISDPDSHVIFGVFSHGSQVKDISGDEEDGMDECIVMKDGLLIDDNITDLINKYRKCERLSLFADICHSTIYDFKDFTSHKNLTIITSCSDRETSKQFYSNGCFSLQFWNTFKEGKLHCNELRRRLYLTDQTPQIFIDGKIIRSSDTIDIVF